MRVFIPRFLGAIAYLVALTVVGAVGYVAIEGWPWRDAVYMTVITVTAGTLRWSFWQWASRDSASGSR